MNDAVPQSSLPGEVTIEIRSVREIGGRVHARVEDSVTIRCGAASLDLSIPGTRIAIQLRANPIDSTSSPSVPACVSGADQPADTADPLPAFGTPEYAAAYRQMWARAGQKIGPNILAWGCNESP